MAILSIAKTKLKTAWRVAKYLQLYFIPPLRLLINLCVLKIILKIEGYPFLKKKFSLPIILSL